MDELEDICARLNATKDKICDYILIDSEFNWDRVKKFTNEYEFIYTNTYGQRYRCVSRRMPVSRSFYKLREILIDLISIGHKSATTVGKSAHICEGPGGFIEAAYSLYGDKLRAYGLTLLDKGNSNKYIPSWKFRHPNLWTNNRNDLPGNIYNYHDLARFIDIVGEYSCDLVTADGGFDFSDDYNSQEFAFHRMFIIEVYALLRLIRPNGIAVIKIYDLFTLQSKIAYYLLYRVFQNVFIVKPDSSRAGNSERYIVCIGALSAESRELPALYSHIYNNTELDLDIPPSVIADINRHIIEFAESQIDNINDTISLIQKLNESQSPHTILAAIYDKHREKAVEWCRIYD